jgi:UDP-3-O-acyl N-acetylglucosamine deacetylase
VGFVTGAKVRVLFCPAPADTGITFARTDAAGNVPIRACLETVSGTQRRTTLGSGQNQVTLVEHVLAALSGLRIDNCAVHIDGPEPPGLDGSAQGYVAALCDAGIIAQDAQRSIWTVSQPVLVRNSAATLTLHPAHAEGLRISYLLDYGPGAPIAPQVHSEWITPEHFRNELAGSRTFVLEDEARELQRQGIGRHLTPAELLVFGRRGVVSNRLRRPDEPARHKILDIVGDLALCGFDLAGHLVAYRSGHELNVDLARTVAEAVRSASKAVSQFPAGTDAWRRAG